MKPTDALKLIRERADDAAPIPHAVAQMVARKIDLLSVIRCLKRGRITEGPYRDIGSGEWRCNVEAGVDDRPLRIVVEIPPDGLLVITAIALRKGGRK